MRKGRGPNRYPVKNKPCKICGIVGLEYFRLINLTNKRVFAICRACKSRQNRGTVNPDVKKIPILKIPCRVCGEMDRKKFIYRRIKTNGKLVKASPFCGKCYSLQSTTYNIREGGIIRATRDKFYFGFINSKYFKKMAKKISIQSNRNKDHRIKRISKQMERDSSTLVNKYIRILEKNVGAKY